MPTSVLRQCAFSWVLVIHPQPPPPASLFVLAAADLFFFIFSSCRGRPFVHHRALLNVRCGMALCPLLFVVTVVATAAVMAVGFLLHLQRESASNAAARLDLHQDRCP